MATVKANAIRGAAPPQDTAPLGSLQFQGVTAKELAKALLRRKQPSITRSGGTSAAGQAQE